MYFRFSKLIKFFALGIFLISLSINGMQNNQSVINQLLETARENKGKTFVVSGLIIAGLLGYRYRSPIKQYLWSWFDINIVNGSNPDLSDIDPRLKKRAEEK